MKNKKSNLISILALVCALAALVISLLGAAAAPEDQTHLIDDLYAENHQLNQRLTDLEQELYRLKSQLENAANLEFWELGVQPWADSTGADVTFTATPAGDASGISAAFRVELNGQQIAEVPCQWNGSEFSATVPLGAADGYSYFCLLSSPVGNQLLTLSTPFDPVAEDAVYLQTSLSAYCNLVVNDWTENPGVSLVLTDAYAQAQLPQISTAGTVEIVTSEIVLLLNRQESCRIPIQLAPSEVAGSYDLTITDLQIPMPELQQSDVLELLLEVTLSDGRHLNVCGITWTLDDGKLISAVG